MFPPLLISKKRSFTLVEIIVATIILSLVMLGLLGVFVAGNKHIIHIRERMSSAELGKFFIDSLQMHVRQDTWSQAGNPLIEDSSATQTVNNRIFTANYVTSNITDTDLRRVITTVTWNEPSS